VKIEQDVGESCELVYRLLVLGTDVVVVAAVVVVSSSIRKTPDNQTAITVS